MSTADIVIILIVAGLFAFCVYKMVQGQKQGECADCSSSGSCNAGHDGHCQNSQELLKKAAAAAEAYEKR